MESLADPTRPFNRPHKKRHTKTKREKMSKTVKPDTFVDHDDHDDAEVANDPLVPLPPRRKNKPNYCKPPRLTREQLQEDESGSSSDSSMDVDSD